MKKKFSFCFGTIALVSAFAASSYHVSLSGESTVGGKSLTPGDYRIELKDNSAVLKQGKNVTEVPAKVETADKKYSTNLIRYNNKHEVTEICLGGTAKKVVFANTQTQAPGM